MEITFSEIKSQEEIKEVSLLASKIWNAYYPSIISQAQINYMLDKMYSLESLNKQIFEDKNIFIAASIDNEMTGFISFSSTGGEDFFIHKLYVSTENHNKGIGRKLFNFVFENKEVKTIRLTVNRKNFAAVNFYFRIGFIIESVIDMDIGEGFEMNDFVMLYRN